jgi:hypothetical protein
MNTISVKDLAGRHDPRAKPETAGSKHSFEALGNKGAHFFIRNSEGVATAFWFIASLRDFTNTAQQQLNRNIGLLTKVCF